jgi:hypothetical protein
MFYDINSLAFFGIIGPERIYTVKEIATDVLECSERTVRDAIHDPHDPLPAFNVGRGTERNDYRVIESDLLAWMKRRAAKAQRKAQKTSPLLSPLRQTKAKPTGNSLGSDYEARRAARLTAKKR